MIVSLPNSDTVHAPYCSALSRARRVFLMAGIPFSGKTRWLEDTILPPANLYVDACFDTPGKRRKYIEYAKEAGLAVECVWINPPLDECVQRSANANGPAYDVLSEMHHRLNFQPPSLDEGFSVIQEIRR